ncbi:MAG: hypothetical protein ABGW92_02475, partial [Methanocaldococcus sp.]
TDEQWIILNHLTYSASKLWNVANYEIIQGNIKLSELEKRLKDSARNILFKVVPNPERGRDSGLGNPRRVRVINPLLS